MALIDQDEGQPERETGWTALDRYVRDKIRITAARIERADEFTAFVEVEKLNTFLKSESLMGARTRLQSEFATIFQESEEYDGALDMPVDNPNQWGDGQFVGELKGCVSIALKSQSNMRALLYDLAVDNGEEFVRIHAPVDGSKIEIDYEDEEDEIEREVHNAFTLLEAVADEDYQAVMQDFQNAYWDTSAPLVIRLRSLAEHATELLTYEEKTGELDRVRAIIDILKYSVEAEISYEIKGYTHNEMRDEKGGLGHWIGKGNTFVGRPEKIDLIPNFTVNYIDGHVVKTTGAVGIQPVLTLIDTRTNEPVSLPMRYIAVVREWEYIGNALTGTRSIEAIGRAATTGDFETHGEWYYRYKQDLEQANRSGIEG